MAPCEYLTMIASDLRDTANDLDRSARIMRCVKTDDFISKSDIRKLVVKWETPYEHFDEDYDIPNRFTCADDVKQLLGGGE